MLLHALLAALLYIGGSEAATAIGPQNTNFTGIVNKAAVLACNITNFGSTDTVQWQYKATATSVASTIVSQTGPTGTATFTGTFAQRFAVNGTTNSFNLIVRNVTTTDSGQYFCQVGGLSPISPYLHIGQVSSLIMKQNGNSGPDNFNVGVNADVTVECTATLAKPLPVFKWYLGSTVLDTSNRLTSGVTTPSVAADSSGFYTMTSSLRTKFSQSDEGKILTCAIDLSTAENAVYTYVTLGVGSNLASKALLAALLAVVRAFFN